MLSDERQSATPTWAEWRAHEDHEIAGYVRAREGCVALCLDATRRWYAFDYLAGRDPAAATLGYMEAAGAAYARLITLLVAHGLDPIYLPFATPLRRGAKYTAQALEGLEAFWDLAPMRELATQVRIRTYGSWPRFARIASTLDRLHAQATALAAETRTRGPRLFWQVQLVAAGAAAGTEEAEADTDPLDDLLRIAGGLQQALGRPPARAELLAHYYHLDPGESLPTLRLLISAQLKEPVGRAFPLLLGGREDLYFPVGSLLSLQRDELRAILYDWLFLRHRPTDAPSVDYLRLPPGVRADLAAWYAEHRHQVLGLGRRHATGDFWYPRQAPAS